MKAEPLLTDLTEIIHTCRSENQVPAAHCLLPWKSIYFREHLLVWQTLQQILKLERKRTFPHWDSGYKTELPLQRAGLHQKMDPMQYPSNSSHFALPDSPCPQPLTLMSLLFWPTAISSLLLVGLIFPSCVSRLQAVAGPGTTWGAGAAASWPLPDVQGTISIYRWTPGFPHQLLKPSPFPLLCACWPWKPFQEQLEMLEQRTAHPLQSHRTRAREPGQQLHSLQPCKSVCPASAHNGLRFICLSREIRD